MQHHDRANGFLHVQQSGRSTVVEGADHWLSDPCQLMNWQGELVNCCHAINDQLTQIKAELKAESEQTLRIFSSPSPAGSD